MLNYSTRLNADTSQHDEALKKSVSEVYKYQKATEEAGGVMTKSIRQQMTELTKLVAQLELLGKTETKEYRDAVAHLSRLKDQMADITQMTSMMASDTKNLDIANKSLGTLVSVMGTLQGVTSMTGVESEKLGKVMKSLQVVLGGVTTGIAVANLAQKQFIQTFKSSPWGWIATAIGLIAGALLSVADNSREARKAEEERLQAEREAVEEENKLKTSNDAQAKIEIANMEALIRKANDLTSSYKDRKRAVRELNEVCPQANFYLKDEESQLKYNVKAYEDYVRAIQLAARAKAYEKVLEKSYADNAVTELKAEELRQKFWDKMKIRNDYSRPESERRQANQDAYEIQKQLEPLNKILDEAEDKRKAIKNIIYDIKTEIDTLGGTGKPTPVKQDKPKEEVKYIEGSINDLQKKLSEARDKLNNLAPDSTERQSTIDYIKKLQEEIDKLSGKEIKQPKPEKIDIPIVEGSINDLNKKLSEAREKFNNMAPDDDKRQSTLDYIKQLQDQIDRLNGKIEKTGEDFDAIGDRNKAIQSVGNALGNVAGKLNEIGSTDLGAIVNVAAVIGQAVASLLLGYAETSKKAAESPQNTATGGLYWTAYSMSALAQVLGIISAIKSAGKFAQGGIIGGSTTVGDLNLARVNKGEMILNQREQRNLWNQLRGVGVSTNRLSGDVRFEISGDRLYGVLQNHNNKINRVL